MNMKKIIRTLFALVLLASPALSRAQEADRDNPMRNLQKFNDFYRYLNSTYVDTVHNAALVEKAIREVLLQLDPHSVYLTAEEMKEEKESFGGSFSGIGVEFNVLNDTIIVVNVIAGGPSEKAGVLPNDRIVEVNGSNVVGTKRADVPKILRGPKGSRVQTKIVRHGEKEPLETTIVRDDIPINTIDAAYKIDDRTGYVKINRFASKTYREFVDAVTKMGPIDALILDLRGNGGGLLDQAAMLSNHFLPAGSVVVSTEGMKMPADKIVTPKDGAFTHGKVVVLVNENSASASEIVSGAIQDWDRGLIVGRRTFGKGLVQRQFPLSDGSAVRLTISRYHTPTGRVIQRPFEKGNRDAYYEDFVRRFDDGAVDSVGVDSTQMYRTLRSGRTVYGGGGIAPDIVVPVDTSGYTKYWSNLIRKGVVGDFVIDYMDRNRASLSARYPKAEKFAGEYVVPQEALDELVRAGERAGVEFEAAEFERSKKEIALQLKALIAQKLWGTNEFYLVYNTEDPEVAKALEVLQNWDRYGTGISF